MLHYSVITYSFTQHHDDNVSDLINTSNHVKKRVRFFIHAVYKRFFLFFGIKNAFLTFFNFFFLTFITSMILCNVHNAIREVASCGLGTSSQPSLVPQIYFGRNSAHERY